MLKSKRLALSVEFIKQGGNSDLAKAKRQQKDIGYLTMSSIQEDITLSYIEQFADSKYRSNDDFLNWVKMLFKRDNFIAFYKYLRFPLPSAKLVNDEIVPALSRVFYSEDSYFNYNIKGEKFESVDELDSKAFNKQLFDMMLFNYNDILITDMKGINEPNRYRVSINDVVAIETEGNEIERIAYTAEIEGQDGLKYKGYAYLDEYSYKFYDGDFNLINDVSHDLGECPADFITSEDFGNGSIIKASLFSYVKEEFEEYAFLKILLKMTNVNGLIPIATMLKTRDKTKKPDVKGAENGNPAIPNMISSQQSQQISEVAPSNGIFQAGTIVHVDQILKEGGALDMDAVKNWINFFHAPVEPMEFIKTRIKELKTEILNAVIGNIIEDNKEAKNELQIKGGLVSSEDKLRAFSRMLTRIRIESDRKFLALKYGKDRISVEGTYGSQFFFESVETLYTLFNTAPNVVERKNILIRIAKGRNKENRERATREVVLYKLLPFISDKDFETANSANKVDDITIQYQLRFDYWIAMFEAKYGDIIEFWDMIAESEAEKQVITNKLILQIIKDNTVIPVDPVNTNQE